MICRGLPWNRLLFICLFYQYLIITIMASSNPVGKKLISVEFEVSGKVQGVFFRKYTQQESNKLGLKGWCMNTEHGTVQGVVQGDAEKVEQMKLWLLYKGSPSSKIEKVDFKNEKEIKTYGFTDFRVRR